MKSITLVLTSEGDTTTVGELKKALQDIPDDYRIFTEGCDCMGPTKSIEVDDDNVEIVLCRS